MTVYVLFDIDIHDDDRYARYKAEVPALIAKHGGEYLARGGNFMVLAGDWRPTRLVMFRFPSADGLSAFMADPDYQELKALREETTTLRNLLVIEGIDA